MTKHLLKTSVQILVCSFLAVSVVSAQSPTTGTIRDAVQQKVQEELANIKQAVAKKGFVGTLTAKTEAGITITNLKNQQRSATVAADATVRLTGGTDGTPADLKVNDFVLAMGDVDSENKMTVKRLLVLRAPTTDTRQVMYGTVTAKATNSITIENAKKETWTIRTSSTTVVSTTADGKVAKAVLADIEEDSKVVVVGNTATGQNTLTGQIVHLIN